VPNNLLLFEDSKSMQIKNILVRWQHAALNQKIKPISSKNAEITLVFEFAMFSS
jgi:hypothetical protein